MSEDKYIKLQGSFYFDPAQRTILRKQGGQFIHVMHDRRRVNLPVTKDRRAKFEEIPVQLKPIAKGLFFNPATKEVFRRIGNNYVLYSKDRRQGRAPKTHDKERRGS